MEKIHCANCGKEANQMDLYKINENNNIYLHWHCDEVWNVPDFKEEPVYFYKDNRFQRKYILKVIKN